MAKKRIPEQKRVKITSKRQFTIPQQFYTELGFKKDAICAMGDGFLVIYPAAPVGERDISEQILAELIVEGYSGTELLDEFKRRQAKIKPAVEKMMKLAREVAASKDKIKDEIDITELLK
jgi:bifunctional DNA-binding transcriptional regulator/antitoxin component of YhaV-PrlF toxin-antitoxin module